MSFWNILGEAIVFDYLRRKIKNLVTGTPASASAYTPYSQPTCTTITAKELERRLKEMGLKSPQYDDIYDEIDRLESRESELRRELECCDHDSERYAEICNELEYIDEKIFCLEEREDIDDILEDDPDFDDDFDDDL